MPPTTCSPKDQSGCGSDAVCEEVDGGNPACFAPVIVTGTITDIATQKPINGARLVALDSTGLGFSIAATSNVDGSYHLSVPAKRDASGAPLPEQFSIRVDADGYVPFAKAPRTAPTLDVKDAKGPPYVVQSMATDIALLHLKNTMGFGSISGAVSSDDPMGALVVAGGKTGVADRRGNYIVYDVAAGDTKVEAFKQGQSFDVNTATVTPYQEMKGVTLNANMAPTVTVTGTLQITNPGSTGTTSVDLVVEDTFDAMLNRGETPPGFTAKNVGGDFSITGVPPGQYVVLPGLETDGLVRAPDTSVNGAPIVHITVGSTDVTAPQKIKATGAMAVIGLGATGLDQATAMPMFSWQADPNADSYKVDVFDAFGTSVWSTTGMFSPGAGQPATLAYGGPQLQSGMIYQFRATSLKGGAPESATEDLTGAFLYQ